MATSTAPRWVKPAAYVAFSLGAVLLAVELVQLVSDIELLDNPWVGAVGVWLLALVLIGYANRASASEIEQQNPQQQPIPPIQPMMSLRSLTLALTVLALSACGSTGGGSSDAQGSLIDALMAAHAHSRMEAAPQQAAFEERVAVGMTQDEVIQAVTSVARDFRDRSARSHTVRASGGVEVTSSGTPCFQGGEPASRSRQEVEGVSVEVWEYHCFDKVYALTFTEGRLSDLESGPLRAGAGGGASQGSPR